MAQCFEAAHHGGRVILKKMLFCFLANEAEKGNIEESRAKGSPHGHAPSDPLLNRPHVTSLPSNAIIKRGICAFDHDNLAV